MKLFQNILISIALLTQLIFAIEIAENKVDRGSITLNLGDIIIYTGATWSIIDNAYTNFVGKLDVRADAGLYITLTSHLLALQVSLTTILHSITNNGIISFDSRISRTSSSYDLRGISFTNNGEMYFGSSGESSSSTSLTSALWSNTGLLLFFQNQRTSGTVNLGVSMGSITNDGQICLNNQVYEQTTQIKGSGCFTAKGDSTIYIANVVLAVSSKQNFYLTDKGSSMIVQAVSTTQTFNVYGFGDGNKIGLTLPLVGTIFNSAFTYDTASGILTLRNTLLEQKFNIGTGYEPSKFQVVTDSGSGTPSTVLGSVAYYGHVPTRTLPKSCQIPCKPIPEAPGTQPTEYTTTITKTNTAGNTVTETGVVNILTDKAGSWFTTTSIFPTLTTAIAAPTSTAMSTDLSSSVNIPVETSSNESSSITLASSESSAVQTSSIEIPVSSHISANQESSSIGESSVNGSTMISSESALESASEFTIAQSSDVESYSSSEHSITHESSAITSSSTTIETHVTESSVVVDSFTSDSLFVSETQDPKASSFSIVTPSDSIIVNESSIPELSTSVGAVSTSTSSSEISSNSYFPSETHISKVSSSAEPTFVTPSESIIINISEPAVSTDSVQPSTEPQPDMSSVIAESLISSTVSALEIELSSTMELSHSESLLAKQSETINQSESNYISETSAVPTAKSTISDNKLTSTWESSSLVNLESTYSVVMSESEITPIPVHTSESATESAAESSDIQTQFTSTWTTTKSDGSFVTESGVISQSGTSFTTIATFPPLYTSSDITTEFISTWTATNSDGSVTTEIGVVSQSGTSLTTIATFPPSSTESGITSEFISTWTTTSSDGSVATKSGVVIQSGTSLTTIATFPPMSTSSDIINEFTSTWTTTNSDGSITTESGIVSQSGTSLTTLTIFEPVTSLAVPSYTVIETEFTSTWTTTKSDGSIVTGSGIVSQSGTSLTTLTTFAPSSSSSSEITPEFTSTWEISSSNESNVVESSIVNQSNESLTNSVSSYEPATESAIVSPSDQVLTSSATSFVSASEFSAVTTTTTTVDSASASSSTDINNGVTVLVSPSESEINTSSSIWNNKNNASGAISTSESTSTTDNHDGSLSMTKTELEINGFYSTESSTMFVTATITSCNESDCFENVVTYVSNDSYTTVTTGHSNDNTSVDNNNVPSTLIENVSNTETIPVVTNTEEVSTTVYNPLTSTSTSNIVESSNTSIVDNENNGVHINSDDMTAMVTAVETGNGITNGTNFVSPSTIPNEISETGSPATSIVGTLPYENGSNQLSIENIKYLILVVFGLMMIM